MSKGNDAALGEVCYMLFHYGVFDLPLPCRFGTPTVANLETDLNLPSNKLYNGVQFLPQNHHMKFGIPQNLSLAQNNISDMTTVPPDLADVAFSNLYPAVIECFAVILCGYAAGRGNLISEIEAKGLNIFVGTFSLPALIFISMAKLDFSSVNWLFLSSLCISKTIIFFMVVLITLLVHRPSNFSQAGLYAIFCTQSNDFALGYPIVAALYGKNHPEFASYLYLVAPVSFVLLNPIGFFLMEFGKRKSLDQPEDTSQTKESGCKLFLNIFKDFATNPFVFMTVLGILGNFIFNHHLPIILEGILKVLSQAFSACALFLLGLSMVGKVQNLKGAGLVAPGILIAVKTIALPLVIRETVSLLKPGLTANETEDYSNYGFLYGTFPTAPGVFVFATKYGVGQDMIASAMVACTFLSAPLMFISAKMVTLANIDPYTYVTELEKFLFNVSVVGLVAAIWVILVFVATQKWKKVPHFITLCLAISQCLGCIGALMWVLMDCNHTWKLYVQFIFFTLGVFSTRIWTALLAFSLFMLRWQSMEFVLQLRPYFVIVGWGIPSIVVGGLIIAVQQSTTVGNKHDPNFHYGSTQAIAALLLLWFSLFSTIVCMILHKRFEKRFGHYESLLDPNSSSFSSSDRLADSSVANSPEPEHTRRLAAASFIPNAHLDQPNNETNENNVSVPVEEESSENDSLFSYKDHLLSLSSPVNVSSLIQPAEHELTRDRDDEFQMMRHVVLLLLLCGSMTVGFALCMWTLVSQEVNGVYVELVFLDVFLNFGQAVFTAVIFGMDGRHYVIPLLKSWRKLVYGATTVRVPAYESLDQSTKQTCEQFTTYHMDKCTKDIVRDRKWRLKCMKSVFCGSQLVEWLLMVGLAHDRTDAVKYGRKLLEGGIIRHIEGNHHFHDQPLFYSFVRECVQTSA